MSITEAPSNYDPITTNGLAQHIVDTIAPPTISVVEQLRAAFERAHDRRTQLTRELAELEELLGFASPPPIPPASPRLVHDDYFSAQLAKFPEGITAKDFSLATGQSVQRVHLQLSRAARNGRATKRKVQGEPTMYWPILDK